MTLKHQRRPILLWSDLLSLIAYNNITQLLYGMLPSCNTVNLTLKYQRRPIYFGQIHCLWSPITIQRNCYTAYFQAEILMNFSVDTPTLKTLQNLSNVLRLQTYRVIPDHMTLTENRSKISTQDIKYILVIQRFRLYFSTRWN